MAHTYMNNALSASTRVGGAILALVLALPAADMAAMLVTGGNCMIPVGGSVLTLQQARTAFQLLGGLAGMLNLGYQEADLMMFCFSGKPIGAPTVFCQVLFPEKSVGIPFFQQGIFPAFSGHYASLRMRACSIR